MFHTINYEPRLSHFDPHSDYNDFRGFFILFWISLTIMVMTTVLRNIKDTGYPFRVQMWKLLSANVIQLGISDFVMVFSTCLNVPLQKLFRSRNRPLQWRNGGIWIQSIFQAIWLAIWVEWPFMLHWTWTAQVYFALHTLTFLMKMHSYAFYNGHLGEAERRLRALDKPETASLERAIRYPSSPSRLQEIFADETRTRESE
jgi:sterol O-acyltransferase